MTIAMHRTRRAPLGSRNVNVENNNVNNAKKSSKAGGGGSSASSEPVKKGPLVRQHSTTSGSTASTASLSSAMTAATSEQNKAFSSMSSDALRRAVSSTSSQNSGGGDASSTAADAGPGTANRPLKAGLRNAASVGSSSKDKNAEPITIIEHRKRPCGDGYTVHKYIRGKMLGKGGFAKVYKVTSCDTNKEYAVKIVPKANLVKSRARQKVRFGRAVVPSHVEIDANSLIHTLCMRPATNSSRRKSRSTER